MFKLKKTMLQTWCVHQNHYQNCIFDFFWLFCLNDFDFFILTILLKLITILRTLEPKNLSPQNPFLSILFFWIFFLIDVIYCISVGGHNDHEDKFLRQCLNTMLYKWKHFAVFSSWLEIISFACRPIAHQVNLKLNFAEKKSLCYIQIPSAYPFSPLGHMLYNGTLPVRSLWFFSAIYSSKCIIFYWLRK